MSAVNAKRYITRSSKAGTLLLCEEETLPQKTSARSRQASKENSIDNAEFPLNSDIDGGGFSREKNYQDRLNESTKKKAERRMKKKPDRSRWVDWKIHSSLWWYKMLLILSSYIENQYILSCDLNFMEVIIINSNKRFNINHNFLEIVSKIYKKSEDIDLSYFLLHMMIEWAYGVPLFRK